MKAGHRRTVLSILAVLCLVVAGCSSGGSPEGDGSRVAKKDGSNSGDSKSGSKKAGGGKSSGGKKNGSDGPGGAPAPGSPGSVAAPGTGGQDGGSFAPPGPPSEVDPSLARKSAFVEEAQPDAKKEGLVPPYAEVIAASIEGLGENFRMTVKFNGQVPERMENDKTFMVIGWGLAVGGNEAYGFSAQGSSDGWRAYAGAQKGEVEPEFPGKFFVDGNSVIMEVPWDYIEGPRTFRWQVNMSWFKSLAGTTHYAFDPCPNERSADFPGS